MPPNHPSSCFCPSYLKECDGKCGHSDCSTTPPPSRRKNEPKCDRDLTMCGVPGATSGEAYKCTNVTSDSYTCMYCKCPTPNVTPLTRDSPGGGCVKASPFGSPSTKGVNCHDISNVDDVYCQDSKCFVHSCKSGFTPSVSNDGCVAIQTTRDVHVGDNTAGTVSAVAREELSDKIVSGSVVGGKVTRTDTTSGISRTSGEMLPPGKVSLSGA